KVSINSMIAAATATLRPCFLWSTSRTMAASNGQNMSAEISMLRDQMFKGKDDNHAYHHNENIETGISGLYIAKGIAAPLHYASKSIDDPVDQRPVDNLI